MAIRGDCADASLLVSPLREGKTGQAFVLRGGSWNNNQNNCRSAYRNRNDPDNQNNNNGCRVVAVPLSTLPRQNRRKGLRRAHRRGVQTCSGEGGDAFRTLSDRRRAGSFGERSSA